MKPHFHVSQDNVLFFRIVTNKRRLDILNYLESCRLATNKVIAKILRLRSSQVSKDLAMLLDANLVKKEKIGTQMIYFINQEKLDQLKVLFF